MAGGNREIDTFMRDRRLCVKDVCNMEKIQYFGKYY